MDAELPAPLVAGDVDLHGFSGFMLDVDRLLASELVALGKPDECWAALMLWCRAWKQSPPGSLPADDRILAAFSGAGARWPKVKEIALRGFILCSDGRLYHQVLAKEALSAWQKRKAYIADQDRLKKWREKKREGGSETQHETPSETGFNRISEPERQGQGQEHLESSSLRSDDAPAAPKAKRTVAKGRSQIPPDWQPDAAGTDYAAERGVNADQEVPAFRNHHQGRGSLMASWSAAWRTWCDNQVKFGRAPGKDAGGAMAALFATVPACGQRASGTTKDPWGVRAWIAKARITTTAANARGVQVPAVNGYMVEVVAEDIATAADLDAGWRGNWDAIGAWMRDDVGLNGAALAAIRGQAARMKAQGQTIGSIAVFDNAVRTAGRSAA